MIVKNRNSIVLGKSQRNNQGRNIVTNPKRKINSTPTPPPPTPEDSNVGCLNLAAGLYKKKYEGYFDDVNEFFDTKLVNQISFVDSGKTYRIINAGTATDQDWYSWGFFPQPEYDTPEALNLPFPSIGKGVYYDGFGSINNAGTASVGPILVSEEVTSQIDDNYSQAQGQNNKSLIIKGYFKPTVNGVYKFRLYSDDASYLWFGNDALDGNRTTSNAVVSLPGIHGPYHTDPPGTFTMVANSYYPLTVEFGNGPAGEGVLIFDYMPPGSDTWTSDLAGKLFYDIDSKGHRACLPPSAYFGRVLSLDAVPYDENPNQILFDGAGVQTVDGVYVYTQTGAPISGSMFHNIGFYGPVVSGKNNFVEFDVQYGKTGYFVGDWIENDWTYFNTGNIPFVNRVEVTNADFNVNDTYARLNSGDNTFLSINENNRRIVKNQNNGWNLQDDDDIVRYTNDDINLDPNGWYYDYTNTVTLNDFYGYVDGTVYTHQVTITNGGTFDGAYTRPASSDTAFFNGTKTIASKGEEEASVDAFRGWYLYDSDISDPDFPRYGINTDDAIPTTLPAYTSVKSFRVSGLTNIADDGVYSRSAGGNTPFTKAGSNPIKYRAGEDHGWRIWTDVDEEETAIYKLSNSAEITTGGWQRDFVDKIVFSGANNIANGTYVFKNQYANEEEDRVPVLTILGSGGTYENRGWRISATDDFQTNNLALQSPPQTTWWDRYEAPVWYTDEEFGNPIGMQTIMTSSDRGLTWTSPYIYQFNLNGFTGPHAAYNKTYKFTSAGSLIPECGGDQWISANRIYYGNNMFYDIDANLWRLQFLYTYSNNDDTFNYIITLQKTGPSPVGTWTSINLLPCESDSDTLIIGGTIVGSNAIPISAGSGTFPTLSIFEIEYVSGDGNYLNPTLTSQIGGDTISVDGTYTRNRGGTTSFSNGSINYFGPGSQRWEINVPGGYNNGAPFANEDFNLTENNWFAPNDESFLHVGTSSYTTARYYPAGDGIATNSNGYSYDFTSGEWQSTNTGYNPAPNAVYSHVWLDSISGFNNSGVMYTGNKHVTLVNNPVYSSDYSGVYSFNGVDQYAMTQEVPQSADGSISYFIWFKPTGAGVVVDELGQPGLFGGWHDSQLEVMQDGKVNFGIWGDYRQHAEFKIQSTGSIDFDRWHHLGLTYSSGVLSAYIDGQKIANSNCQRMNGPTNLYYAICGGDSTNMGEGGFGKGSVGSFQVYNKGLTEIQVGNLYSGEKDRFPNIDNMFLPSLWLDASTGVNKFDYNYISQIVLDGNSNVDGTYNASSIPSYNFEEHKLNNYSLGAISYDSNEGAFNIIETQLNNVYSIGFNSYDGQNWNVSRTAYSRPTINGLTNGYEEANGTYDYNDDEELDQLVFYRRNNDIYYQIEYSNINNAQLTANNYNINETTPIATLTNGVWSMAIEGIGTATGGIITSLLGPVPNGTITTSNVITDYVNSWTDQSSNENNAISNFTDIQNVATLAINVLNSKPVLRFDGSLTSMTLTSDIGGLQYTIFIVCKNNDNQKGSVYLWRPDDHTKYIGVITDTNYNSDATNKFILSEYDAGDGAEGSLAWSSLTINNDFFIGTALRNGGGKAYLNGYGGVDGMGVFNYPNTFNTIGGYGGGFDIDGDIAEIISYNRALTTSERQEVENYLKNKYTFSDTIYWGEDYSTACAQTLPLVVTGDGLTFCDSNTFRGQDLVGLGTGQIYISYNGQLKTVNHVNGDNFVTFNGGCGPCPSIPSAPNLSVIDGGSCGEVILQWDAIDGGLPITSYSWYNPFDGIGQEELINIGNNGLNASIIDQRFVDTSYSFKIKVQNELGTSEWSNIVNFTASTINCSVPSAPYELSVSNEDPDSCLLGLMYQNPDDPQGNINYFELATNEDGDNWTNIGIQGSDRNIAFIGLPVGETSREYFIRVRAVNSVGASPAVGPQSVILSKCI
jgi:hypothetical protein